jgi:hypothetical protein
MSEGETGKDLENTEMSYPNSEALLPKNVQF